MDALERFRVADRDSVADVDRVDERDHPRSRPPPADSRVTRRSQREPKSLVTRGRASVRPMRARCARTSARGQRADHGRPTISRERHGRKWSGASRSTLGRRAREIRLETAAEGRARYSRAPRVLPSPRRRSQEIEWRSSHRMTSDRRLRDTVRAARGDELVSPPTGAQPCERALPTRAGLRPLASTASTEQQSRVRNQRPDPPRRESAARRTTRWIRKPQLDRGVWRGRDAALALEVLDVQTRSTTACSRGREV